MILSIERNINNSDFPFVVKILANGREKSVGVKNSSHLKKRLFELNQTLLLSDEEFETMLDNHKSSGIVGG